MAEDKKNVVTVKDRAKAFLTTKPEAEPAPVTQKPTRKRASKPKAVTRETLKPSAVEIAAAARKAELLKGLDSKKQTEQIASGQEPEEKPESVAAIVSKTKKPAEETKKPAAKNEKKAEKPAEETKKPAAKSEKKAEKPAEETKKPAAKSEKKAEKPAEETKKPAAKSIKKPEQESTPAAYIQYKNETFDTAAISDKAQELWTKDRKQKASALKSLEIYIKPEDRKVYCVFNGTETGNFDL